MDMGHVFCRSNPVNYFLFITVYDNREPMELSLRNGSKETTTELLPSRHTLINSMPKCYLVVIAFVIYQD